MMYASSAIEIEPHRPEGQAPTLEPIPQLSTAFARCPHTSAIYNLAGRFLAYEGDYFLDEYRAQYGRTYLEDEAHIRKLARSRLDLLQSVCGEARGRRLLEPGCATGFFLDEARQRGFETRGLEVSEFAAGYARETLGLDVRAANFLATDLEPESADVIAAFYVLEHFAAQRTVFQKISDTLTLGGCFVFALPSVNGPLFEYDPGGWERSHPADHFVDYSPASLRRTLALYGFELLRTRPASFHPNRARGWKGSKLFRPLYPWYARARSYGDTFEGVAVLRRRIKKPC